MEEPTGESGPSVVEAMKHSMWGTLATGAFGALGLLAYMLRLPLTKRQRENKSYARRVKGPWRDSDSHVVECERRLRVYMRRTKRKDRRAYVLYRDMYRSSRSGDQVAYTKAVDSYKAHLQACKK